MSAAPDAVQEFAASLTRLKERTDRSYGQLARRLTMNTSTLHRYCAGDTVPLDFAPVERFAALCGATGEERLELHRLWLSAVAARQRTRTGGVGVGSPTTESAQSAESAVQSAEPVYLAESVDPAESADPVGPAEPGPSVQELSPSTRPDVVSIAPPPRRPWYRRRRTLVGAAVAAVLLATLGSLAALPSGRAPADSTAQGGDPTPSRTTSGAQRPSTGVPLTWTANSQLWEIGCSHDYVIAKPPKEVPPPPTAQDAGTWAATQRAVHGRNTIVEITVQGRESTAVVLTALRVRVVGRTAPAEGNVYAMDQGCGGVISPRYFGVDLDKGRPIARPVDGSDMGTPVPAVRLPYRVSAEDPEVLMVTAETETCDCRWYLELEWSSEGRTGTIRIDDDGRPFRTTAIKGLPRYGYAAWKHQWEPDTD